MNLKFDFCSIGVTYPQAIIKWQKGDEVEPSLLQPEHGRMFAKNDYLWK